jgi:hypothetical protein
MIWIDCASLPIAAFRNAQARYRFRCREAIKLRRQLVALLLRKISS